MITMWYVNNSLVVLGPYGPMHIILSIPLVLETSFEPLPCYLVEKLSKKEDLVKIYFSSATNCPSAKVQK